MIALCCNVVLTHEINAFLSTPFLFFQYEVVAMDSTKIARSHPNKRNRSKDIFTLSGCEKSLLTPIFLESTEQNTYKAFDNKTQTVPMNTGSSENREFKQTPADKQNAPTEDVEEEPKLEPQDLLLWALKPNKLERFSKLLELPEVGTKFKYVFRDYTTCMELACRLPWGGKFVNILLEHGVKPNVHEIHQEPIHFAAKCANSEALDVLLQNENTKINAVDSSGLSLY